MLNSRCFRKLKLCKKELHLRRYGTYILSRKYNQFKVDLYLYNRYYVEMYRSMNRKELFSIDLIHQKDVLDTYLDEINIDSLGFNQSK